MIIGRMWTIDGTSTTHWLKAITEIIIVPGIEIVLPCNDSTKSTGSDFVGIKSITTPWSKFVACYVLFVDTTAQPNLIVEGVPETCRIYVLTCTVDIYFYLDTALKLKNLLFLVRLELLCKTGRVPHYFQYRRGNIHIFSPKPASNSSLVPRTVDSFI